MKPVPLLAALLFVAGTIASPVNAEESSVTLPSGTSITLILTEDLSSKTARRGDTVAFTTATDLSVSGKTVVPAGTAAVGRVDLAQDTGAFGQSGKLGIEPLYISYNGQFIRLTGRYNDKGTVTAGAAVGMVILSPGFTGRSAKIPAGSTVTAQILRDVAIPAR